MKHNKGKTLKWYPIWIDKWLWGSMRHELIIQENEEFVDLRGIFCDLLTLSKKDGGYIRANEITSYPLEQLAGMFCVPLERLKQCIDICLQPEVGKLTKMDNEILFVTNHENYDLSKRYRRQFQTKINDSAEKEERSSQKAESREEKRREKERKEEKKIDCSARPLNLLEVIEYLKSRGSTESQKDGEEWWDHYESNGWKVGRLPMKSWQATCRQWLRRKGSFGGNGKRVFDEMPGRDRAGRESNPKLIGEVMKSLMDCPDCGRTLSEKEYHEHLKEHV